MNIVRRVETEVRVGEGKKVGGIALGKGKGKGKGKVKGKGKGKGKGKKLLEENGRGLKNIK